MKLPGFTRRRVVCLLVAAPVVPALLWTLVLMIAPTDWARARLVGELEAITGRKVAIGSIRLGPLGNLRIGDVTVAELATPDDPWLKVAEARLDVHLVQMLAGCCKPCEIGVDGLDLRVHRRADGTLEFAGLLDGRAKPLEPGQSPTDGTSSRHLVTLTMTSAHVVVIDDPSETRIELAEGTGTATWDGTLARIESLRGRLNGGSIELAGTYDRSAQAPEFFAEMRARRVALGNGMKSLGLLVPIVADASDTLAGKVDLALSLRGRGESLGEIKAGLKGFGAILLGPIDLSQARLVDALDVLHKIPASSRVGSVESHFAIEDERIRTDDLTLKVAQVPVSLAGWTDFSGRIDYRVKSEAVREKIAGRLPVEARQILGEIRDNLGDLANLRVTGTVDAPVLVTGRGDPGGPGRPGGDDEARIRAAARKLRDKYLR